MLHFDTGSKAMPEDAGDGIAIDTRDGQVSIAVFFGRGQHRKTFVMSEEGFAFFESFCGQLGKMIADARAGKPGFTTTEFEGLDRTSIH